MNLALQKFLIKCVPIASWRDKLRLKHYYGDKIFNGYLLKSVQDFYAMKQCKDDVEEFCIGSSHAQCGYLANGSGFNLGYTACDLYYSTRIARYWMDAGMARLKRIIVFYDPFSPAHNIEKSRMAFCALPWQKLYGIPPRGDMRQETVFKSGAVKVGDVEKVLEDRLPIADPGPRYTNSMAAVCNEKSDSPSDQSLEKCKYTRLLNQKPDTETQWLVDLYEFATARNVEVVVVVAPAHSIYRRHIGLASDELYSPLRKAAETCGFKVLNYWTSSEIQDSDFFDIDHLNKIGALKLTNMIHRDLCTIASMISFPVHGDHTGSLVALEKGADFPFEIKRVYYIWGTAPHVVRGHHAHKNLEQVVVCTSGSCDFILDDGVKRETYHLDSPMKGLHIKNNVWREFTNFSPDCVVMVLASEHYNESDYIRDYDEFLRSIGK